MALESYVLPKDIIILKLYTGLILVPMTKYHWDYTKTNFNTLVILEGLIACSVFPNVLVKSYYLHS